MNPLVNSIAYQKGQRLGEVAIDDISEVVKQPDTFVWLGLHEPDAALLRKMQEEFGLHDLAIEDALNAHQQPKIEQYGESLFIVLKTVQPDAAGVVYGETHLFVGRHYLISVRHGESSGYQPVRKRCEESSRMLAKGPGFALYALLDFVVDQYEPVVHRYEQEFARLEEQIFKGHAGRAAIESMYDLKRSLLELRHVALPVTDICSELVRFHEDLVPKELRVYLRDVQDHVSRVVGRVDSAREMVTTAMQVNLALIGIDQNEVVKQLAGWAAILAIPTVVYSQYGMNFREMPELQWRFGYPMAVAITVIACVLLWRRLRRAGWI